MSDSEKVFVDGFFSNKVPDTAPAFILGDISILPDAFMTWLQNHKHLVNDKGYLRITIKESQGGKRYAEVNTWKPSSQPATTEQKDDFELPDVNVDLGEADPSKVPEF